MATITFDTLKFVEKLKAGGVPELQAKRVGWGELVNPNVYGVLRSLVGVRTSPQPTRYALLFLKQWILNWRPNLI